jgi:large subunit ribosomal protein L18
MEKAGIKTQKRRRKEQKTDYGKRLKLLKSGKPRIVVRRTNRYIISQYIVSKEAQDKIELTVISKDLIKNGWPESASGSLKSLTASYLTGYLMGKKIQKEKKTVPIVDVGMVRMIHGNRIFAFIKGLIDSGLKIECKKEAFPSEGRLNGESLKNKIDIKKIKSGMDK